MCIRRCIRGVANCWQRRAFLRYIRLNLGRVQVCILEPYNLQTQWQAHESRINQDYYIPLYACETVLLQHDATCLFASLRIFRERKRLSDFSCGREGESASYDTLTLRELVRVKPGTVHSLLSYHKREPTKMIAKAIASNVHFLQVRRAPILSHHRQSEATP